MEMGAAAEPPRAVGARRYKVLVPWRFQRGIVREPLKHAAAVAPSCRGGKTVGDPGTENCGSGGAASSGGETVGVWDAKDCGSGGAPSGGKSGAVGGGERQSEGCTPRQSFKNPDVDNGGRPVPENACDLGKSGRDGGAKSPRLDETGNNRVANVVEAGVDCNLGSDNCDGSVKDAGTQDSRGTGDGAACDPEVPVSNVEVKKCFAEGLKESFVDQTGLKSNDSSASDLRSEDPEINVGLGDSACHTATERGMGDVAAKENDAAAKGCSAATPDDNGNGIYCRKGRKAVVPWRFQVGYKRSFSKAFGSDNGSPDCPSYGFDLDDSSTPATRSSVWYYASAHSGVRVSAMRDFSSVEGANETGSECKKRKTNNDDQDKGTPNNGGVIVRESIMRSLQDFRLIYRELLDEEEENSREEVLNVRPDLQAYRIFRERFSTECDDKKYIGSVPGIYPGDIFHLRVELCVVGLHRPHRLGIDYTKRHDGTSVAISIVSNAQSYDNNYNLDVLVYSGSVAVTVNQKIEGTNLALKKSMDTNTPVRVIHGFSTVNGKKEIPYLYIWWSIPRGEVLEGERV